jgi:hypothetical protein
MKYVNFGVTGLRVSRICLGMMSFGKHPDRGWALDEDEAEPIIKMAIEGADRGRVKRRGRCARAEHATGSRALTAHLAVA